MADSSRKKLLEIACEIEKRFDLQEPSSSSSSLESGNGSLDDIEQREIERVEYALTFINQVRDDIDSTFGGDPSVAAANGSTIHSEDIARTISSGKLDSPQLNLDDLEMARPKEIGRFEVIDTLGQGGFAKVFLARDPYLARLVALKVPRLSALMSAEAQTRFEREARAAAGLSHPNIAAVFESGSIGPIHYIASSYCAGKTLGDWFKQARDSKIDIRLAAQIVARLADAVQHAHQRGVVHRDLKPDNVLFEIPVDDVQDEDRLVDALRITDFGLAKVQTANQETLTLEGAIVGTPAYMSPEQTIGDKSIGEATDIYSLGVILYELLTGQLPHLEENHMATMRAIERQPVVSPQKHRAEIGRDLESICLKCLNKRTSDRYATAHDLQQDLQDWLEGRSVKARRPGGTEKLRRWCRRNPAWAAAIVLTIASLAAGLSLTLWQYGVSQANLQTSNQQRDRALKHLTQLEGTIDFVLKKYSEHVEKTGQLDEEQRAILEHMLVVQTSLIEEESEQLEITPELIQNYQRAAKMFEVLTEFDQAQQYLNSAIALIETVPEDDPDFGMLLRSKASVHFRQHMAARSADDHQIAKESLAGIEKLLHDPRMEATTSDYLGLKYTYYRHLGLLHQWKLEFGLAEQAHVESVMVAAELMAIDPDRDWELVRLRNMLDLATINSSLYRFDTAENYFQDVLRILERAPEKKRNKTGYIRVESGAHKNYAYMIRGFKPEPAREHFERSVELSELLKAREPVNQHSAPVHGLAQLAEHCERNGWYERATSACDRALIIVDEMPARPFQIALQTRLLNLRAGLASVNGDPLEEARAWADRSLKIAAETGLDSNIPNSHFQLWRLLQDHDKIEEAQQHMQLAMEGFARLHRENGYRISPKDNPTQIVEWQSQQAIDQGQYDAAIVCWERLIAFAPDRRRFYLAAARDLSRSIDQLESEADRNSEEHFVLREKALSYLNQAVSLGYDNHQSLANDKIWDVWRDVDAFQEILDTIRK